MERGATKEGARWLCVTTKRDDVAVVRSVDSNDAVGCRTWLTRVPLAAFLEEFCRYLSARRTRKSYSAERSALRVFFGPICPALQVRPTASARHSGKSARCLEDHLSTFRVQARGLEDITPAVIERFLTRRILESGISSKTANRYREILHLMFNYVIRTHNFVSADARYPNPAAAVPRRREPPPTIRFLSAEDITRQLAALELQGTIRALVATYIYAGLRREEALWLTHDDVDMKRRLIRVAAKTVDGHSWQPKTKRNRVVPVSAALLRILEMYQAKGACIWRFPSPHGRRWDPDNFSRDLREINRKHQLSWSCLDFRHTFGSHLAQKGESLFKIAELMGNSPEICRRHYAGLIPEKMHDVVEFEKAEPPDDTTALLRQVLSRLDRLDELHEPPASAVR